VILLATASGPAGAQTFTTLGLFNGSNGSEPLGGLTLSADGTTLYGTTSQGGASGSGTVFSIPLGGGTPTALGSFNGSNGASPRGSLTVSADGSTLYGTTYYGGASNNDGTVFGIPVGGGTPTALGSFSDSGNGYYPCGSLTLIGSTLYGTTSYGSGLGGIGYGTVFSIPVGGGTPTDLASFNGDNGFSPRGSLTLSADGSTFYGTTFRSGVYDSGNVFSIPVGGGTPANLGSFSILNGCGPSGSLTLSADGSTFYGTTSQGGASPNGNVFSIPVGGATPTSLGSFNGSDGSDPLGSLTLSADGTTLYGTTYRGGAGGFGTVFSIPVGGGTPADLVSFSGSNGAGPGGDLTLIGSTLYGTTESDAASGDGTVFAVTLPTPEPSTFALLSVGAIGLATYVSWRRRRAARRAA
jgi:uncharacterized repeat protein (TIGR03803 family)